MLEYAIIVALAACIVLGVVQDLGRTTAEAFCKVSNSFSGGGPIYTDGAFGPSQATSPTPAEAKPLCGSSVAYGRDGALVIANDGTVWGWGNNDNGDLGSNNIGGYIASPVQLPMLDASNNPIHVSQVGAGLATSAALDTSGHVWVWGRNIYGMLGNGTVDASDHPIPTKATLPAGVVVSSISVEQSAIFAMTAAGDIWEWGANTGEMANGTSSSVGTSPAGCDCEWLPMNLTAIYPQLKGAKIIANDSLSVYALLPSGEVWSWARNLYGELGAGFTSSGGCACVTTPQVVGAGCCRTSWQLHQGCGTCLL